MTRLLACAAVTALLCACSPQAEEPAPQETEAASEPVVTAPEFDTMESYVGTWEITYPDGAKATLTNDPDGTYTLVRDGSELLGLWSFGTEQSCWQEEEAEEAACYTVGAAQADGSRVMTRDDGTVVTVKPVTQ